MADGNLKDLPRWTVSEEVLRDKAFNIAKSPKYEGCQAWHASLVYIFFLMKSLPVLLHV